MPGELLIGAPHPRLRSYVDHYWLSLDNRAGVYPVLPDACVDMVLEVGSREVAGWVYGTTTGRADLGIVPGHHYLGVRFKPGRARHFIDVAASELTNCRAPLTDGTSLPLAHLADRIDRSELFFALDGLLLEQLRHRPPQPGSIDRALACIAAASESVRVAEVAMRTGLSSRQLERLFQASVGVSPGVYLMIRRYQQALGLLAGGSYATLAELALMAGYADQSHMNRDFRQFTGMSPGMLSRDVALIQDRPGCARDTQDSPY